MSINDLEVADILGRYEPLYKLPSGGQKVVYAVRDSIKGKIVIKIGRYRSSQSLERAKREVQVLSTIDSPYFPRHYSFEVIDNYRYLIEEEFINGNPLHEHFADFSSEQSILEFALELVQGLNELWVKRTVHRDIKPANILIAKTGPKIIDLGIARLLDATSLTNSMAFMGPCTPNFASPEQLSNIKRKIDHRSDQFSLGILLVQLVLGGKHPFDPEFVGGENIPNNILQGLWAKSNVDKSVSRGFGLILHKLLSPQPYMRYRKHEELYMNLLQIREEQYQ